MLSVGLVDFAIIWNRLIFYGGRDLGLLLAVQTTANQADKDWEGLMGAAAETFCSVIRQGITRRSFHKFSSLTATSLGFSRLKLLR